MDFNGPPRISIDSMDFLEFQWISLDFHVCPRSSMDVQNFPSVSEDFSGFPKISWISVDFDGFPWISIKAHGVSWIYMGSVWFPRMYIDFCGFPWMSMDLNPAPQVRCYSRPLRWPPREAHDGARTAEWSRARHRTRRRADRFPVLLARPI